MWCKAKLKFVANCFCVLLLTSIVGIGNADQVLAQAPQKQSKNNSEITLNLQDVDIRVLINTVAEVTGKNFIVDPRVKGKVSVVSGGPLNAKDLYDVFLSVLEVHNFATVNSGSVTKVLPSNIIKQRPTPFGSSNKNNDAQITQIIALKHASVQELSPILRPLIPPTSHFAPHQSSNSVVVTDTAANIQRVLKIIRSLDVPDKRSSVHVVYLDKTKASDLAGTLNQIVASNADPKTAGLKSKVTIQPLDSIGALVINAPDEDFAKLKALIDELDIERKLEGDINVIYLKHAKAEDLVTVLNEVTKTTQQAGGPQAAPMVQADEATNSLIVRATGSQLQTMMDVIEKLDLRRAQVYVETVIAEVSLNQAANLGVTWGAGGKNGVKESKGKDGEVVRSGGIGNLVDSDNRNQILGTAAVNTAFKLGSAGLNYTLLDFKKYQLDVVINALRSDSNSNILSTPTLLTLDNEEAEIVVGQEVPFVTSRYNSGQTVQSGAGTVQPQTGTGGNNFGNGVVQSIERKDVGIKLKIKPQISDGDTIQLEVMQEISSLAGEAVAGQADLITNTRSIDATVQVDDGQVVVLGGLIQDDVIDTVNRVPILGSIPVIGALFRSKSKKAVKRNLMVFLKPRIIRSADELAKYSKVRYDEVRRDSEISQTQTSDFLIEDADPPILVEYEEGVGEGEVRSERRKFIEQEHKERELNKDKPRGVMRLLRKNKNNNQQSQSSTKQDVEKIKQSDE